MNNEVQAALEVGRIKVVLDECQAVERYTGEPLAPDLAAARARYTALLVHRRPSVNADRVAVELAAELAGPDGCTDAALDKAAKRLVQSRSAIIVNDAARELLTIAVEQAGAALWSSWKANIPATWAQVVARFDRAASEAQKPLDELPRMYSDSEAFNDDAESIRQPRPGADCERATTTSRPRS